MKEGSNRWENIKIAFFLANRDGVEKHGYELHTPIRELSEEALTDILYGYPGQIRLENTALGVSSNSLYNFEGIIKYVTMQEENSTSKKRINGPNSLFRL